jgi:hypothetical protein
MPFVADLNAWQIGVMEELGKESRTTALKFDARIKGLANTMKNYRGKLVGMKRLQLVAKKRGEEVGLQTFIDADPRRKATYGTVLERTGEIYAEMSSRAQYELVLDTMSGGGSAPSLLLRLAASVADTSAQMAKTSAERPAPYRDEALAQAKKAAGGNFTNYYEPAERLFFKKVLTLAARLPNDQRIAPVNAALKGDYSDANIDHFVDAAFSKTTLRTAEGLASAIGRTAAEIAQLDDPFVNLARELAPLHQALRDVRTRRSAELSTLSALLIDVTQKYLQKSFIPDANVRPHPRVLAGRRDLPCANHHAHRRHGEDDERVPVRDAAGRPRAARGKGLRPVQAAREERAAGRDPLRHRHDRRQLGEPGDERDG